MKAICFRPRIGVVTPFTTSRSPPCRNVRAEVDRRSSENKNSLEPRFIKKCLVLIWAQHLPNKPFEKIATNRLLSLVSYARNTEIRWGRTTIKTIIQCQELPCLLLDFYHLRSQPVNQVKTPPTTQVYDKNPRKTCIFFFGESLEITSNICYLKKSPWSHWPQGGAPLGEVPEMADFTE